MIDLLFLTGLSVFLGIILVCIGLSSINQSLESLEYNNPSYQWSNMSTSEYYKNPLHRIDSKYFHYRPKGSVIVSQKEWEIIERNIAAKIARAKKHGQILGYNAAIIEVKDKVEEEKAKITPRSPYMVLNVEATTPLEEIKVQYLKLMAQYDPVNFENLDSTFVELAGIRCQQILKAWSQINASIRVGVG